MCLSLGLPWLWLLGLALLLDALPFGEAFIAYRNRRISKPFDRFSINCQPMYDAFESDPVLRARLQREIIDLKSLTTREIKLELKSMNLPLADIFDRHDLLRRLALGLLKQKLVSEGSLAQRQQNATILLEELKRISSLSDEEVLRQFQKKKIDVSINSIKNRGELNRKLALLNLGYGPPPLDLVSQPSKQVTLVDDPSFFGDIKNFAAETVSLLKENVRMPIVGATKEVGSAVSITIETALNFTGTVAYTKAEKKAKRLIQGEAILDEPEDDEISSSLGELQDLLAVALQFETFDDAYYWGLSKSRASLVKLLQMENVSVPKYAPKSTVASFLADFVMAKKNTQLRRTGGGEISADDETYELLDKPSGVDVRYKNVAPRSPQPAKRRPSFDAYEPERILIARVRFLVGNFLTKTLPLLWSRLMNFEAMGNLFDSIASEVLPSPASFSFASIVQLLASGGIGFASWLGRWAGGTLLSPSQTLFLASVFCMVMRRGLISFMGILVLIRFACIMMTQGSVKQKTKAKTRG